MSWQTLLADHVKEFEGLKLEAYDDFRPNYKLKSDDTVRGTLTIGYGHTGPDVHIGMKITEDQAERLMLKDLDRFIRHVDRVVKVPLTDHEKAALISFAYNVGETALSRSTLLRKLNAGDRLGAANEFPRWNKSKGKVLTGLVRRREAERAMFLTADSLGAVDEPVTGPVEGGEAKPMTNSKTQIMGLGGVLTAALAIWTDIKEAAPELLSEMSGYLPYLMLMIFVGVMVNRFLESRRGEH